MTLTAEHVRHAIDEYFAGRLDEGELSEWAEVTGGRDDIGLDATCRTQLADALFELSTPELFGPMPDVAAGVLGRLR